jgi:hypothetical protein
MKNKALDRLLASKTVGCLEESDVDNFLEAMKYVTNQRKFRFKTVVIYKAR